MAKRILVALTVAVGLAFASDASAQVALDLKLGYALPTGSMIQDASMTDIYSGAFVLGVDGRYRFTPNLSAGVYFQWNPAFVKSSFCGGASCSGYDMRVGAELAYAFMPDGGLDPWVSIGTGWQWTQVQGSAGGVSASLTVSGWEYFNAQAGIDFPVAKAFAIGPYVGYSGGTYTTISGNIGGLGGGSDSIPSEFRTFHGWFQFGLKGTLNL
jgi:hypothetical protein